MAFAWRLARRPLTPAVALINFCCGTGHFIQSVAICVGLGKRSSMQLEECATNGILLKEKGC